MKIALLAALAALSLTTAARAEGEGNGDPFPFRAAGVVISTAPATVASRIVAPPRRTIASVDTSAPRHP